LFLLELLTGEGGDMFRSRWKERINFSFSWLVPTLLLLLCRFTLTST
jgi:hypothetical protein